MTTTAGKRSALLGQYAGIVTRGFALVIDIVIVTIAVVVINWIVSLPLTYFLSVNVSTCLADPSVHRTMVVWMCRLVQWTWLGVTFFTAPLYFGVLISLNGQTIGKYIMGVRVVRVDGRRMTFWRSVLRWLSYFLSALPLGLGFSMALVDDQRRTLHDRITGTVVIYAWRARRNEVLVERVGHWFEPDKEPKEITKRPAITLSSAYELVLIAVPSYRQLQSMLSDLENSVIAGEIAVVRSGVMVKDADGKLGTVSVDNLMVEENTLSLVDTSLRIPEEQLARIQTDAPEDVFLLLLLIKDQWLKPVLNLAARRSPSLLTHYDLGDQADALTASQGAHPDLVADHWANQPAVDT
jgi:uncharacterized RDD family membrane protein YckC